VATAKKPALVRALSACVDDVQRGQARRFLQGLSTDELQFIAEFLGSCILESGLRCCSNRRQLAEAIKQFAQSRRNAAPATAPELPVNSLQDQEHKMILLLEYLCRSGLTQFTIGVGAGQG